MMTSHGNNRQVAALTIAGSDSGGNAGVQADIRAFHVFGLHACTAIAALTAQNPYGVRSVRVPDTAFLRDQLDAIFEEYSIAALKTGMLATAEVINAVADKLSTLPEVQKVVDPVMVATSGAKLLADDAIETMRARMLPLAALITPNIPEAQVIAGRDIETKSQMERAAADMFRAHGCAVLVKGGHKTGEAAEDVLVDGDGATWFSTPFIADPVSTHGTGCSLSAAIAASLASGRDLRTAVVEGKAYVYESIRGGVYVGPRATVLGTPAKIDASVVAVS